jgi:pyridoxal phosphate enzyme (YggS family)
LVAVDPALVRERVEDIRRRLAGASHEVELLAVTKGFGPDAIAAAASAGCSMVGENYAQELLAKVRQVGGLDVAVAVHFIGRLQSNKVRQLASVVDVWESVDRESLLDEIAARSPGATVLIQVNATGEEAKGGCDPVRAGELVERARHLGLDVDGMMTVGPTSGDLATTDRAFATVRGLVDRFGLRTCSMGMTHDLDRAVAAGSTRVRLGTALFGPRPAEAAAGRPAVHGERRAMR